MEKGKQSRKEWKKKENVMKKGKKCNENIKKKNIDKEKMKYDKKETA